MSQLPLGHLFSSKCLLALLYHFEILINLLTPVKEKKIQVSVQPEVPASTQLLATIQVNFKILEIRNQSISLKEMPCTFYLAFVIIF